MATDNLISPLNESHYDRLVEGLKLLDRADAQLEMASRAGIDVGDFATQSKSARTQILAIKNVYFPGR